MKNILFYKYVQIENLEEFKEKQLKLCKSLALFGKILIANEGINGNLSGDEVNLEKYMQELRKDGRFSDMVFKTTKTNRHNFKRMFVKIREEIVTSGLKLDLKHSGIYVEPKELKKWLDNKEDVLLIDARNDYEYKLGRFKGAINPSIDTFR